MKVNKKTFSYILTKITECELYELEKKILNETILTNHKISNLIKQSYKPVKQTKPKQKMTSKISQSKTQKNKNINAKRKPNSDEKNVHKNKYICENNYNDIYKNTCNNNIFGSNSSNSSSSNSNNNSKQPTLEQYITDKLKTALINILLCLHDIENNNCVFYSNNMNKFIANETLHLKHDFVMVDLIHKIFNKSFDKETSIIIKSNLIKTLEQFNNNLFIHETYRHFIASILFKTIKLSHLFERRSSEYKKSKYKIFNHYDLLTNPIESLSESKKFILYQDNKKYIFNVVNLINYIENKLLYQEFFECYPCQITNPYTNVELESCELYKLYFHCLQNYITIPLPFTLLFKANMNNDTMLNTHHVYLQNAGLENTVKTMSDVERLYYLNELLSNNEFMKILSSNLINVYYKNDKDKIMFLKNEIEYYVLYNYSINIYTMESMYNKLKEGLLKKKKYLMRLN